jgi:hypothetical protein
VSVVVAAADGLLASNGRHQAPRVRPRDSQHRCQGGGQMCADQSHVGLPPLLTNRSPRIRADFASRDRNTGTARGRSGEGLICHRVAALLVIDDSNICLQVLGTRLNVQSIADMVGPMTARGPIRTDSDSRSLRTPITLRRFFWPGRTAHTPMGYDA